MVEIGVLAAGPFAFRDYFAHSRLRDVEIAARLDQWRGRPLVSHQTIVQLIAATTTDTGFILPTHARSCCAPNR
jgi:hypothetical protein